MSPQPNHYDVCVSHDDSPVFLRMFGHLHADGDRLSVTFSQSHEGLQLPNPQLLALHTACARVTHMSGVTKAFEGLWHDIEDIRVLAFDGSSVGLLDHCLTPFAIIPGIA